MNVERAGEATTNPVRPYQRRLVFREVRNEDIPCFSLSWIFVRRRDDGNSDEFCEFPQPLKMQINSRLDYRQTIDKNMRVIYYIDIEA